MSYKISLANIVGAAMAKHYVDAAVFLGHLCWEEAQECAFGAVELLDKNWFAKQDAMLQNVGQQVCEPMAETIKGAAPVSFDKATKTAAAPVSGYGVYRLGEDGRLYLAAKSEHYHIPFGHSYPGYRLVDNARRLGVPNATHNNIRGHIVRMLEEELVRQAKYARPLAGMPVLDRVHNLETGSIACEAAIKYMLSRFYRTADNFEIPLFADWTPVFFVMQDNDGGTKAGYHGTTIHAQMLRGMWPEFCAKAQDGGLFKVVGVKPNDIEDFAAKITEYNKPPYKTAGFLHEIILMNYGAISLTEEYLQATHALCREHDTPVLVDEIQSCAWYPDGGFLFKRYGLYPDFLTIGKGFSGGEYASSRLLFDGRFDKLAQFDALVTNGQQELSALCYLITFRVLDAMKEQIGVVSALFESRLGALAAKYPRQISRVMGDGHMSALEFHEVDDAVAFASKLNERCIDSSAQTYKANCPPTVLMKLPVVATENTVGWLVDTLDSVLAEL